MTPRTLFRADLGGEPVYFYWCVWRVNRVKCNDYFLTRPYHAINVEDYELCACYDMLITWAPNKGLQKRILKTKVKCYKWFLHDRNVYQWMTIYMYWDVSIPLTQIITFDLNYILNLLPYSLQSIRSVLTPVKMKLRSFICK